MVKTLLLDIGCETDDGTCGECEELYIRECPKCRLFQEDLKEGDRRKPLRCEECLKAEKAAWDIIHNAAATLVAQGYIEKKRS
jgi:hypothetical protein